MSGCWKIKMKMDFEKNRKQTMKDDVYVWARGRPSAKRVSKETLNHRALIEAVSGLDVYRHAPRLAHPLPRQTRRLARAVRTFAQTH